jgi:hypothetical protein
MVWSFVTGNTFTAACIKAHDPEAGMLVLNKKLLSETWTNLVMKLTGREVVPETFIITTTRGTHHHRCQLQFR